MKQQKKEKTPETQFLLLINSGFRKKNRCMIYNQKTEPQILLLIKSGLKKTDVPQKNISEEK